MRRSIIPARVVIPQFIGKTKAVTNSDPYTYNGVLHCTKHRTGWFVTL